MATNCHYTESVTTTPMIISMKKDIKRDHIQTFQVDIYNKDRDRWTNRKTKHTDRQYTDKNI